MELTRRSFLLGTTALVATIVAPAIPTSSSTHPYVLFSDIPLKDFAFQCGGIVGNRIFPLYPMLVSRGCGPWLTEIKLVDNE